MALISFGYLVKINLLIAILVTLSSQILSFIFERLRLRMKKLSISLRKAEVDYREFHQNLVDGIKIIANYQKEGLFLKKDELRQGKLFKLNMDIAKLQGFGYGLALALVYFLQALGIVIGYYEIQKSTLTPGDLVAISTLVGVMVASFSGFGRSIAEMQKALVAAKKVLCILDLETQNMKSDKQVEDFLGNQKKALEIRNVKFDYGEHLIFDDLQLNVQIGETILIRGRNGVGKSTIFKLILDFFEPIKGVIYLLGQKLNWHDLNLRVRWLPTDDYIFSTSLQENIFWKDELSEWERTKFLELAQMLNFKYNLSDSIQVKNMSGGEIQKLKLIRALLTDADIYLLDEPFNDISEGVKSPPLQVGVEELE